MWGGGGGRGWWTNWQLKWWHHFFFLVLKFLLHFLYSLSLCCSFIWDDCDSSLWHDKLICVGCLGRIGQAVQLENKVSRGIVWWRCLALYLVRRRRAIWIFRKHCWSQITFFFFFLTVKRGGYCSQWILQFSLKRCWIHSCSLCPCYVVSFPPFIFPIFLASIRRDD